jgi:hypothetical protein
MSTLKLLQEQKDQPTVKLVGFQYSQPDNPSADIALTQYFQVHFQHIHENICGMQDEVKHFQQNVSDLSIKLDKLSVLITCLATQQNSNQSKH